MANPSQPVKLLDVATAAGVSIATASRALTGKKRVAPATTRAVVDAARRLGYVVDPIARALREGSTRTVGMVVPVIGNPHFSELIAAVENSLQADGFELIVADSNGDAAQEARRLQTLVGRRVDGIVLVLHDSRASASAIEQAMRAVPVVQLDRKLDHVDGDFVGIDESRAMRLVLEHLVDRQVHRVVFASADDANSAGRGRRQAFEQLVEELGLATDPHVIADFSVQAGRDAADQIVHRGQLPDAVVAGSDVNAVGVISRLQSLGVRVPDDVLVTGFDGTQLSEVYIPSITTVRQPVEAIARSAVSFLFSRIADPARTPRDCRINCELVVRTSTSR